MAAETPASDQLNPGDGQPAGDHRAVVAEQEQPLPLADAESDHAGQAHPEIPQARAWIGLLLVVGISAAIIVFREEVAKLGAYGYPGLFLINLFSSATLFLPVPGLALAFAAGSTFNPFLVGLAIGLGSTLGELTGYLAGMSGRGVIKDRVSFQRVQGWMQRYGVGIIFVLSLVPNPVFDVAGITAGMMHLPIWQFLLASGAGKIIKASAIAYAGASAIGFFQ